MATVSELKEKARQFEQEGQPDKALQIYRHILKHFEGKPSVVKVLPLYVKVGDLLLKSDRPAEAVASFERAAETYAEQGAAQRVAALCQKIERAAPDRSDCYAHFTRRLIEHDHVGSARDVLAGYAEARHDAEMQEALDDLAGRSMHEIKPLLVRLLDSWRAGEAAPADDATRRMSSQLQEVTDQEAGDISPDPEPDVEESTPTIGRVAPVEFITQNDPPRSAPRRAVTPGATAPRRAVTPEDAAPDPPVPAARPISPAPASAPRRSATPLVLGGFAAGLVAALGLSFILPFGRGESPSTPVTAAPETPVTPTVASPLTPVAPVRDSPPGTPLDSPPGAPLDSPPGTPAPAALDSPPAGSDTVPATPTVVVSDSAPAPAPAVGGPIVVDGLPIESVSDSELRGVAGYRVVHTLSTFGALTIESYPETSESTTLGRVRMLVTPPDTVVGIVRLPGHMVYASGVMPEDSLRALMSRLVEQRN